MTARHLKSNSSMCNLKHHCDFHDTLLQVFMFDSQSLCTPTNTPDVFYGIEQRVWNESPSVCVTSIRGVIIASHTTDRQHRSHHFLATKGRSCAPQVAVKRWPNPSPWASFCLS